MYLYFRSLQTLAVVTAVSYNPRCRPKISLFTTCSFCTISFSILKKENYWKMGPDCAVVSSAVASAPEDRGYEILQMNLGFFRGGKKSMVARSIEKCLHKDNYSLKIPILIHVVRANLGLPNQFVANGSRSRRN